MAQKQPGGNRMDMPSLVNLMPADLAETGKKRMEDFLQAQNAFLETLQQANRQWLDRLQTEAAFVSEFSSKLSTTRSLPEAMSACQDYTKHWLKMMAEDGEHLFADSKALMETGARMMSNSFGDQARRHEQVAEAWCSRWPYRASNATPRRPAIPYPSNKKIHGSCPWTSICRETPKNGTAMHRTRRTNSCSAS